MPIRSQVSIVLRNTMLKFINFKSNDHGVLLIAGIFLLAMLLRCMLAVVNSDANDYHFDVISTIMKGWIIPVAGDCPECFQPKLYHATLAIILKVLPFDSYSIQIRIAQLVNCIAGGITLYISYLYINKLPFTSKIKAICFSLIALNPKLIAINCQATNDSFVILFSVAGIYFTLQFLSKVNINSFICLTVSAILAGLSKANGLVLFPIILTILLIKILLIGKSEELSKPLQILLLITFPFFYFLVVPYLGQYYGKYEKGGSPFTINQDKDLLPHITKRTYVKRPGVTSIVDSYMTFRFFGLIKSPAITNDYSDYPLHRTSLWTQLYGRTHFVHFDMWPQSWQSKDSLVQSVGRCIYVLALIPSLFMVMGAIKIIIAVIRDIHRIIKNKITVCCNATLIHIVVLTAYLLFIIAYTAQYRDFSSMKAIFIFPGLLSFLYILIEGMNFFYQKFSSLKKIIYVSNLLLVTLVFLYCIDILYLISHLSMNILYT